MNKSTFSQKDDQVVISGMSGRFPESDSTDEFAHNLYQNKDLITEDDRRWPTNIFGLNCRMGKLKSIDKFDAKFFGSISQYGDNIDPQSRILLETTYEAIIDAGINPQKLRATKTGVYIGYSTFGHQDGERNTYQPDTESYQGEDMFAVQGEAKCLYANRISYAFDFKGPSFIIDTACSSSLVALNYAFKDMILGVCDQAIVGGVNLCLQPSFNHIFQWAGANALDGIPKVWDESADGYVRGETIGCVLLQRRSESKRIYATVVNTAVNIDGYKTRGLNFPSSEMQESLMIEVYKGAKVDPAQVTYIEAHATGTAAGDSVEAEAIYRAYALNIARKSGLLIGLSKSVIGHTEGSAGIASVVKLLLAFEKECIPANLHLNQIKSSIKQYCPPLLPTRENTPYVPGIAGVNNFGIGGVNANVLFEPNYKTANEDNLKIADTFPRIVNLCCRTEEAFNEMCDWIENKPKRVSRDFLALLAETVRLDSSLSSSGLPFRGSLLIKQLANNSYEYKRKYSLFQRKTQKQVWFIFPGLGGQWVGMGKAFMSLEMFAKKLEECHKILVPYKINLKDLLLSEEKDMMSTMTNKFCATTAIEIALYEVMKSLNIIFDGVIGHSFGEIAAAYAVGCLNTEEALLVSYFRGLITENDKNLPNGLMAVVGLSWHEMKKRCPEGVEVVCNNGKETVVVSGLRNSVEDLIKKLNDEGVFVRAIDSNNLPYHSSHMSSSAVIMAEKLLEVLPNPKIRPRHWVSTAIENIDTPMKEELKYASAEYFSHNLASPVHFYDRLPEIPDESIVIEVGPHPLFAKAIKETINSVDYISLMKKNSNDTNLEMFLSSIGNLYELGLNPIIDNLYPKVEWPVARGTQSISSLMRWQHSDSHHVKKYPEHYCKATASDMNGVIDLSKNFFSFLCDHCVDGRIIYPATGYLMLAWRQLANFHSKAWNNIPVVFEDVQFNRPLFLYHNQNVKITTRYFPEAGRFAVLEGSEMLCFGKIRTPDDYCLHFQQLLTENNEKNRDFEVVLNTKDIYKDLKVRGYDYGTHFQKLLSLKTNDFNVFHGEVGWDGNWVTFVDSLLQSTIMAQPFRKLMIPVMIKYLRCEPHLLRRALKMYQNCNASIKNEQDKVDEVLINEKLSERLEMWYNLFASTLPYYTDTKLNVVVAPGLEIEGMLAQTIQRKSQEKGLTLESYKFIENEESLDDNRGEDEELNEYLIRSLLDIVSENSVPKKQIQVFEVNLTEELLAEEVRNFLSFPALQPIDVKYTIAIKSIDGSPEEYKKLFKLIEWKPSPSSVFPSEVITTDLIVCNVSEQLLKVSLKEQIQKKYDILVDRGFLLCLFKNQNTTNYCQDFDSIEENYLKIAESLGFIRIATKRKFNSISLLLRKVVTKDLMPKSEDIIYISNELNEWLEPLKEKMRQVRESDELKKLWLISNESKTGLIGMVNCLRLEPGGEGIRCLLNCDIEYDPVNLESLLFSNIVKKDLVINVVKKGKLGTYRHLGLPQNYDKSESNQYFLNISEKKDLSELRWYDLSQSVPSKSSFNEINQKLKRIECDIYMTGINFKDVMLSSGRVAIIEETLLLESVLGLEFVGRSKKTKERVMGLAIGGSFATQISANERFLTKIPDHWSMEEAVTIPTTYSTVWLGLIERAKLLSNERVLIHSGTGGVGQAAINICQFYNCDIFVTVGNNQKKEFLVKTYGIPENRIFSSRDIHFKYEIMKLTEGKGVNIVLNSLTGDKMDASVDCLAKSGRFVEIGKYELQMNKQLGMYFLLKDISFFAIQMDVKMIEDSKIFEEFYDWMHKNSSNGMIKPINTTVFSAEETEKAFRHMTTGKHIGKIVIKLRDEENQKELNNNFNSPKDMIVSTKTYFDPKKVYIITGGLGGMGLEFVNWMLFLGARNFVLTSRSGVKTEYQKFILNRLKTFGKNNKYFESNINVSTVDTNTIEGAKKLISRSLHMGEIGGIFHLALVLNDSLLENQTFESFSQTVDIKAKQFQNLDEISRQMKLNLDYFVVFSSVSCGKGNGGQTNYGYGNSVCERICEARGKDGLHGLAIQWGPIGDVGVVAEEDMTSSMSTVVKQRINSCFEALDKLLQTNESIVTCVIKVERNPLSNTTETKGSKLRMLWQMLGIDSKNTPAHLTLEQLGINSLLLADFQQTMQRDYDLKLSQNQIKSISIGMLREIETGKVDQINKIISN